MFSLNMNINNCAVTVLFEWTGRDEDGGPNWDTMEVIALMPTPEPSAAKYWVTVNDILHEDDWKHIESEIYLQWKELERKARNNDY